MQKARILLIVGIWVTILPYLGFPYSWKDVLFTMTGIVIVCFSYFLYKSNTAIEKSNEKTFDNFVENSNFSENEVSENVRTNVE